eukprot:5339756-Pleurochrysis_carterae.AAC.1
MLCWRQTPSPPTRRAACVRARDPARGRRDVTSTTLSPPMEGHKACSRPVTDTVQLVDFILNQPPKISCK